jgi:hypothetical protein
MKSVRHHSGSSARQQQPQRIDAEAQQDNERTGSKYRGENIRDGSPP